MGILSATDILNIYFITFQVISFSSVIVIDISY